MADTDGDYQLVKVLGRGAFGEAALYRRLEDNSLVVWKEILLMNASEKHRHHAMQEASLLSLLAHPNIIAYYNDFMDGTTLLIEMEYANGGTLYRKIYLGLANEELFAERWVLWMFYQLASAINYIHQRDIIHRDIKSLNIFLTKLGLCKLGDFGLARSLSGAELQAVTSNVGTLAYMSPEIHKGETYNQGSDAWAVGCVLYEMAARSLPFASTEIGRLAVEIVETNPKDLDTKFSPELRLLCKRLLQKDPKKRPTMADVLASPLLLGLKEEFGSEVLRLDRSSSKKKASFVFRESHPVVTSKSSEVFVWGGGRHLPQRIEALAKASAATQVSAGVRHFAAVTVEKELYTWAIPSGGSKMSGQLGHGDLALYRVPRRIESLSGQSVLQVSCGDEFTACVMDDGRLLAFGSNYWGCLGNGGEVETDFIQPVPTPVSFFNCESEATRVRRIATGASFIFAVTNSGDVYSWGNGDMGQLGLGSEECYSSPQQVKLPPKATIRRVVCGVDNTFLVTKSGRLLASGSNESNKSCLDQSIGPRRASLHSGEPAITTVHMQLDFTPVKVLIRHRIVDAAAGSTHSAAIDSFGHIWTFGDNTYGQLGVGHFRQQRGAKRVASTLLGKQIIHASCGDSFTIVATGDQQVYSWGRGDHGQLCSSTTTSSHTSQRTSNSLPRPVFSALHVVSGLSCKHWHSIMIADQVLSKRQLNQGSPVVDHAEELDAQPADSSALSYRFPMGGDTTEVPPWVAQELAHSVIPMPSRGSPVGLPHRSSSPAGLSRFSRGDASDGVSISSFGSQKGPRSQSTSSSSTRRQSPVHRNVPSPPLPVSQRAGSPGRQAVLSVRQPASGHAQQGQRQSSSPVSGGSVSSATGGMHSPLVRSSSAGRPNAIESSGRTEAEHLQQQLIEMRKDRDLWKREAESLQGNRKQLLSEIDIATNKIADLQKMNQRLARAHSDIESLFHTWVNDCNNALQIGRPSVTAAPSTSAPPSSPLHASGQLHEPRSFGAPAFVRVPKSPSAGRRRTVVMKSNPSSPPPGQSVAGRRQSVPATFSGNVHSSPPSTLHPVGGRSGTAAPVTSPNPDLPAADYNRPTHSGQYNPSLSSPQSGGSPGSSRKYAPQRK